jgi:hypothetical protein
MERNGKPRRRPEAPSAPTTLTEITRRYYACAVALARAMGVPMTETFMREHRESISCCFIEAGRAGVRLPPAVPLPPLSGPIVEAPPDQAPAAAGELRCSGMSPAPEAPTNGHTPPLVVPKDAGLPCGGVPIVDLKPAQLAMLISKVAALVHDQGERWIGLLASLQSERSRRLERGRKTVTTNGEG